MKLTSRKFSTEDFNGPEQSFIAKLIGPLNQLILELVSGLNSNNVTVKDNLFQEIKEIKFLNETITFPIKFKTKFIAAPVGLSVLYCKDTLGGTASGQPFLDWSYSSQSITIASISNLTLSKTYLMRLHIIYS